jgi:hypothetical protein
MAQDLQTNCDSNLNSEYNSLRRFNQDDQNVSFGKFSEKTYAYVYETQKWYVKWVVSLGCVEHLATEEFQDYCNSRLLYDTLHQETKKSNKKSKKSKESP